MMNAIGFILLLKNKGFIVQVVGFDLKKGQHILFIDVIITLIVRIYHSMCLLRTFEG